MISAGNPTSSIRGGVPIRILDSQPADPEVCSDKTSADILCVGNSDLPGIKYSATFESEQPQVPRNADLSSMASLGYYGQTLARAPPYSDDFSSNVNSNSSLWHSIPSMEASQSECSNLPLIRK